MENCKHNYPIQLNMVSKFFQTETETVSALQNVCLTIPQGDSLAIFGARKSGKTTLIETLAGQSIPDSGSYYLGKTDFYNQLPEIRHALRKEAIGYLPKGAPLIPTLTLEENITLPLLYRGISKKDVSGRLRPLLEKYALYGRRHHYPHEVPDQLCRLTAFLQATIHFPPILLADDIKDDDLFSLLFDYNKQGNTLIITTDCADFCSQCQHTVTINEGTILS